MPPDFMFCILKHPSVVCEFSKKNPWNKFLNVVLIMKLKTLFSKVSINIIAHLIPPKKCVFPAD